MGILSILTCSWHINTNWWYTYLANLSIFLPQSGNFRITSPKHIIGEGNGTPLQHSCLENPTDGGAWVHGVTKSRTTEQLHFHFSLSYIGEGNGNPLQCSCLENPGTVEPGGLLSMGSHRVGHDWSDLAAAATAASYF